MAKPKRQRFLLPGEDAPIAGLSLPLLPATGIYFLPEGEVKKVIVLFHGMTTNSRIMMAKALSELREAEPHAAVYALDAPFAAAAARHVRAAHRPGRSNCRVWFEPPEQRLGGIRKRMIPQMRAGVQRTHRLLDYIKQQHGLDNQDIYFLGFSQGCSIAFQTLAELTNPLAGAGFIAGFLISPRFFKTIPQQVATPIVFTEIELDEYVKKGLYAHSTTVLRKLGYTTIYHYTSAKTVPYKGLSYQHPSHVLREPQLVHPARDAEYPRSPHLVLYKSGKDSPLYIPPAQALHPETVKFYQNKIAHLPAGATGLKLIGEGEFWFVPQFELETGQRKYTKLHSEIRLADDGYGNLIVADIQRPEVETVHWANPEIRKVLRAFYATGRVPEELGAKLLEHAITPKVEDTTTELAYALFREIPKHDKSKPKPLWQRPHEAFARRRDRLTHQVSSFFNELGRWLAHSKVLQPILFFVPESMSERGPDTVHSKERQQPAPHHIPYIGQDRRKKKLDLSNLPPERQADIKAARAHFESLTRYPDGKPPRNTSEQPKPPPNPRRGGNLPPALDVSLTNQAPNRGEEVRSSLWLREQLRRIAQRWSSTPIIGR